MFEVSRLAIYDYLLSMFMGLVNNNVYRITVPTATTQSDVKNGFIVVRVGDINDESEFHHDTYGWVRCYVTAYIPKFGNGYLDDDIYGEYETKITQKIEEEIAQSTNENYYILEDDVLSMDDDVNTQKGNQYHTYTKSFVVVIDKQL